MTGKNRLYRRDKPMGFAPGEFKPERVERTESEEARRRNRDWLRDRDEDTTLSFAEERGGTFADYDFCERKS